MQEIRLNLRQSSSQDSNDNKDIGKPLLKKLVLIGAFVLLLLCISLPIGYIFLHKTETKNNTEVQGVSTPSIQQKAYFVNEKNVFLDMPNSLEEVIVSDKDKDDGIFARFQPTDHEVSGLITARTESKLSLPANISKKEPLDIIEDSISKSYTQRYPSYKKLSDETMNINGKKAYRQTFTYDSKGTSIKQEFIAIMADDDTAIYLSFQSKEAEFDQLRGSYFTQLVNSVVISQ